jgi:plastocyanin/transposase-like protein
MPACPYCSSSDLTRDGHDQRRRAVRACRACGRHATSESTSLVAGHRFPRDIILLAVRYYLRLGAAAERIAGILADRGVDVSGRTILRWVQKFGPALSEEIRRYRKPVSTTWLVDETYVKILGKWHYLFRGVDEDGQVLDTMKFDPATLTAKAGQRIQMTLDNSGQLAHDFAMTEGVAEPVTITAQPGQKATVTFTIDNPGTYTYVCSQPGHEQAGMKGR